MVKTSPNKVAMIDNNGDTAAFSKKPDCACFNNAPEMRMAVIDEAVHKIQPHVAAAINESGACARALHYLLGALLMYSVGATLRAMYGIAQSDPLLLDEQQEALALALIDATCLNAKERLVEMNKYVKKRQALVDG